MPQQTPSSLRYVPNPLADHASLPRHSASVAKTRRLHGKRSRDTSLDSDGSDSEAAGATDNTSGLSKRRYLSKSRKQKSVEPKVERAPLQPSEFESTRKFIVENWAYKDELVRKLAAFNTMLADEKRQLQIVEKTRNELEFRRPLTIEEEERLEELDTQVRGFKGRVKMYTEARNVYTAEVKTLMDDIMREARALKRAVLRASQEAPDAGIT